MMQRHNAFIAANDVAARAIGFHMRNAPRKPSLNRTGRYGSSTWRASLRPARYLSSLGVYLLEALRPLRSIPAAGLIR